MIKKNIKIIATNNIQIREILKILSIPAGEIPKDVCEIFFLIHEDGVTIGYGNEYYKYNYQEIDADLFIRTNGTCEEISNEGIDKIKAAFSGKPIEYLQDKIINLHKQINKDRATIKNQKEELNKLNNKLQKCISLEEHNAKTKQLRDTIVSLRDDVINKVDSMRDTKNKEIEKLKTIKEYLEEKLKWHKIY